MPAILEKFDPAEPRFSSYGRGSPSPAPGLSQSRHRGALSATAASDRLRKPGLIQT